MRLLMASGIIAMFFMLIVVTGCEKGTAASPWSEFTIITPDGHYLLVRTDGSGQVGFGDNVGKPFVAGSFDFHSEASKLRVSMRDNRTSVTSCALAVRNGTETSVHAKYIDDLELVKRLFGRADAAPMAEQKLDWRRSANDQTPTSQRAVKGYRQPRE